MKKIKTCIILGMIGMLLTTIFIPIVAADVDNIKMRRIRGDRQVIYTYLLSKDDIIYNVHYKWTVTGGNYDNINYSSERTIDILYKWIGAVCAVSLKGIHMGKIDITLEITHDSETMIIEKTGFMFGTLVIITA